MMEHPCPLYSLMLSLLTEALRECAGRVLRRPPSPDFQTIASGNCNSVVAIS
jgi:hypothetical protein